MRNDLGGKALYDFEMKFFVFFEKGDEAAWIVRAQKDKRSGYVFMLQRSRGANNTIRLFLNGWVYTSDGKQVPLENTPNNELNIGKIYDGDHFEIKVIARDNVFSHEVTLQNAADEDEDRHWFGRPYTVPDFKDGENFFSCGTVGFFVPKAGSEILIENFWLAQPSALALSPP